MTDRAPDSQWPTKDEARQMGTDAARMTAPDIVTEARRLLDAKNAQVLGTVLISTGYPAVDAFVEAAPRLVTELVAEVERLRGQHDEHEKVVDWADDALARRDARITELIAERDAALAEVERLRHEVLTLLAGGAG